MKKLLYITLLFSSLQLLALGETGHRVTGEIAEIYLTEHSKKVIAYLLGNESLAEASTYADEMRSNPDEFWQRTAYPYHFMTIPDEKTYKEAGTPERGDAIVALDKFSKILKDVNASKEEKVLAVKFIVHIIGDLHQPLHVGNGTDRGGNSFRVSFFGRNTNLHSVWDYWMLDRSTLSFTEWTRFLNRTITELDVKDWSDPEPLVWAKESKKIRLMMYPEVPSDGELPSLGYTYMYEHMPILKKRLKQAGVRIAAYLNHHLADYKFKG